jgi:hypothetical protein
MACKKGFLMEFTFAEMSAMIAGCVWGIFVELIIDVAD